MQLNQLGKAFVPLIHPLGVIRGHGFLIVNAVIDGGADKRVTSAAGAGHVISETAGMILDPLIQFFGGGGNFSYILRVVGQNHGGAAIRLAELGGVSRFSFDPGRIGDLGFIQLHEAVCADQRNNLGKIVAAQIHQIILGVGLVGLAGSSQHIRHALTTSAGEQEVQFHLITLIGFGVAVEIGGQRLKNLTDVVGTIGPEMNGSALCVTAGVGGLLGFLTAGSKRHCHHDGQRGG